jgi:hypothetical protein
MTPISLYYYYCPSEQNISVMLETYFLRQKTENIPDLNVVLLWLVYGSQADIVGMTEG